MKLPGFESSAPPAAPVVSDRLVLVVESETDQRRRVIGQLTHWGYVPLAAGSGDEALALVRDTPRLAFSLVAMRLPDMSGFEVLLKLVPHPRHPEIPVIILTRLGNPHLLDAAISNGAHAALHKSMASGEIFDVSILKAVSATPKKNKQLSHFTLGRPDDSHHPQHR